MINLSLNELKLIAKSRDIKDYENKSEDELITRLNQPKLKISLSKQKIKEIWEKFGKLRDRFSKSKIKEIRKKCLWNGKQKQPFSIKNKRDWKKIFLN